MKKIDKMRGEIMEELLNFFQSKGISIQITLDTSRKPTVHAFHEQDGERNLYMTEDETTLGALKKMKEKLYG